jgi:hypothetical protein
MVFSLKTIYVATALLASAQARSNGAGGCAGGQAAVMGNHLSVQPGRTFETGSLADGGVSLLLDGSPLDATAATATDFSAATVHVLTLVGTSPYRGLLVRLSAPSGVDTTTALLEVSDDLQDADVCSAPVAGITHTNADLKSMQSMSLSIRTEGEITLDVTVVFANNGTNSIYYYSGYTLNAVMEPVAMEAGSGGVVDGKIASSPTMAPMSGAAAGQQQMLVALAVSGLVAAFALW